MKLIEEPRPYKLFIYMFVLVIVLLVFSSTFLEFQFLYLIPVLFGTLCFVELFKIVFYNISIYTREFKETIVLTTASEFAKSLSGLPIEALELVRGYQIPSLRVYPGSKGQPPDIFVGNTTVNLEFAKKVLNNSDGVQLQPIRDYNDGTPERRMLQELTKYFIELRWVGPAQGNRSAIWINGWSPWNAKISLGIMEIDNDK